MVLVRKHPDSLPFSGPGKGFAAPSDRCVPFEHWRQTLKPSVDVTPLLLRMALLW